MGFSFDRPVGPAADVVELEYVSSLLQTNVFKIRPDGCISAQDVALFLTSRYGLDVTSHDVAANYFPSVSTMFVPDSAGAESSQRDMKKAPTKNIDNDDDETTSQRMDLMEFVTLLLVPLLRQQQQQQKDDDKKATGGGGGGSSSSRMGLGNILYMLLHDADIIEDDNDSSNNSTIIMNDGGGIELTKDMLKRVFCSLGEVEVAQQDNLMDEMIDVVKVASAGRKQKGGKKTAAMLNEQTFAAALVDDVQHYRSDISNDRIHQTNLCSVMGDDGGGKNKDTDAKGDKSKNNDNTMAADDTDAEAGNCACSGSKKGLSFIPTSSFIDFTADTFRSRAVVVCMWVFFGMSYLTYYSGIGTFATVRSCNSTFEFRATWQENLGAFGCAIGWFIARWLYIVATMSVYGFLYFTLAGMGNGIENKNPLLSLAGAVFAGVATFLPPFIPWFQRSSEIVNLFLKVATSLFGFLVMLLNLWAALDLGIPSLTATYVPGTVRAEAMIKKAGEKKLMTMYKNALEMHAVKDKDSAISSHVGQALLNYANRGNLATEKVGGMVWTWKRIWNHELLLEEGLWLSGRLLSINAAQFLLSIFILVVGIVATVMITNEYNPPETPIENLFEALFDLVPGLDKINDIMRDVSSTVSELIATLPTDALGCTDESRFNSSSCTLDDLDTCRNAAGSWICASVLYTKFPPDNNVTMSDWKIQEALLEQSGWNASQVTNNTALTLLASTKNAVNNLYPSEKYMIFWPFLVGTIAGTVTAYIISLTLIPSTVTTSLKLRSGVIALMHEPKQLTLRIAPDQVAFLRGAMFWGFVVSAGLMAVVCGLVTFLLLYQNTASVAQRILAAIIGISLVVTMHWLFVRSFRFVTSQAFYRKRVRLANIILLLRECAFFALSVSFTAVRAAKFVLTSILFLGRVDIPFLADGIGELECFGYRLDNHPYVFQMEIMQHEAHRHPYIEIFGVLSLLKIKYGDAFITRAGSAWRFLLVSMLFPWLVKYRRMTRQRSKLYNEDKFSVSFLGYQNLKRSGGMDSAATNLDVAPQDQQKGDVDDEDSKDKLIETLQRKIRFLKEELAISQTSNPPQFRGLEF